MNTLIKTLKKFLFVCTKDGSIQINLYIRYTPLANFSVKVKNRIYTLHNINPSHKNDFNLITNRLNLSMMMMNPIVVQDMHVIKIIISRQTIFYDLIFRINTFYPF